MAVIDWTLGLLLGAIVGGLVGWLLKAVLSAKDVAAAKEGIGALEARLEAAAETRTSLEAAHGAELERLEAERADLESSMLDRVKVLAAEAAKVQKEALMETAMSAIKEEQQRGSAELAARRTEFEALVKPVTEKLEALEQSNTAIEKERQSMADLLKEQMERLGTRTDALGKSAQGLSDALRKSSSVRGQWGEIALRRLLEMAGLTKGVDFEEQVTADDRSRPDVVVKLPDGGIIPIDAKATGQHYLDAQETDDPAERERLLKQHAESLRSRILDLQRKSYHDSLPGKAQFVVMFVPSDAFVAAAFDQNSQLLQEGLDRNVLVASPVSLLALLRTVELAWRQVRFTETADEMVEASRAFYQRVATWTEHVAKVGKHLQQAADAYDQASRSWSSRVQPQVARLDDLEVNKDGKAIAAPPLVERQLALPRPAVEEPTDAGQTADDEHDDGANSDPANVSTLSEW